MKAQKPTWSLITNNPKLTTKNTLTPVKPQEEFSIPEYRVIKRHNKEIQPNNTFRLLMTGRGK